MRRIDSLLTFCFSLAAAIVPVAARAQQSTPVPHIVRGRVTTDSGVAIAAATVVVTVAPTTESVATATDSAGDYRVVIPNATGEYLLYVSAPGRRAFRRRVAIAAPDTSIVVNVRLPALAAQLAVVRVQASRVRAQRTFDVDAAPQATTGTNHTFDGVTDAISPDLQGNLDAMASLVPGLSVTPNGVSAFGLGRDANLTTLNGMTFNGAAVPRDLQTPTTFFTSPWDPTRGGFSGVMTSLSVARGTNVVRRQSHLTFDSPTLQATDPLAASYGQSFTNVDIGDSRSGPLSLDKYFYNYAIQASWRTAHVASLLDLDAGALDRAGLSPDSARRLIAILQNARIPTAIGGDPRQRTTRSVQFLERFDRAVPLTAPGAAPPPAFNVILGANYADTRGQTLSPIALPANAGKTSQSGGFLQGQYARNFGPTGIYTNETSLGASYSADRGSPYLSLPSADVLVASSTANVDSAISVLNFGGNSALASDATRWTLEATNQTNFLINGHRTLPAKLYVQSRYQHYDASVPADRLGSFAYGSLNDVAANSPTSYSRLVAVPDRSGGEWTGAIATGGSYSTQHWVLSGGLRADANFFTGLPTANPALASTFGVRNDESPSSVAVSPRFGFNWYPTAEKGLQIARDAGSTTLRGGYSIRGGIGRFRSFLAPDLLGDAIGATGLPGSSQRLLCVGAATPVPDWQRYLTDPTAVPSACANGASAFADTRPNAVLVDPSFAPSDVWRATLGWTKTIADNYIAIDGVYSLNRHQAGTVDLNFAGVERFTLPDEDGRPVFVPASSIVPATGAISPILSRRVDQFGRVSDRVSDLRGDTRQLTAYVIPNIPFTFGVVTLGYTYSEARSQQRGFDGGTGVNPGTVEWSPSAFVPRHQFVAQAAKPLLGGKLVLTASGRALSGLRYTPTVAGDVNGDGLPGDRAFLFDPSKAGTPPSVAVGLRDILRSAPSSARECLEKQFDGIAGRNSCVGPWSATMNANVFVPNVPGTHDRVQASLNLANPLGGLDQLLHRRGVLRGWGSTPIIDGTLYQIAGFDSTARRFQYRVNPQFGRADPTFATFLTPFRLTLDVHVAYGPSLDEQLLVQNLRIKPPLVGTRATADSVKARYMQAGFTDIYRAMLLFNDSLALTRAQTEQITDREAKLVAKADSIYTALGHDLAGLPPDYDVGKALKQVIAANDAMWDIIFAEAPFIRTLLTPAQQRRLPEGMRELIVSDARIRFSYHL